MSKIQALVHIRAVGFLNDESERWSIGRLGMASLPLGVSAEAVAALARLTCQAHDVKVHGMSRDYRVAHLLELASIKLVFWPGSDTVKMV